MCNYRVFVLITTIRPAHIIRITYEWSVAQKDSRSFIRLFTCICTIFVSPLSVVCLIVVICAVHIQSSLQPLLLNAQSLHPFTNTTFFAIALFSFAGYYRLC